VTDVIVQACINGARPLTYHWRLPITIEAMVRDSLACIAAGAAELHIHARDDQGCERLTAVDSMVGAVRAACPGTFVGISTGAWIENDEDQTRAAIAAWNERPDYASVNLSERDAPAVMDLLRIRGVGIEAGLATVDDAERFVAMPDASRVLRILIEIGEQQLPEAYRIAEGIAATLDNAGIRRPILLHGSDQTVWPMVELARERRWSTRVGLEDGKHLPNAEETPDNASLVAAAVAIFRR
jgi:uncharacterized protein (DUF849 family)